MAAPFGVVGTVIVDKTLFQGYLHRTQDVGVEDNYQSYPSLLSFEASVLPTLFSGAA